MSTNAVVLAAGWFEATDGEQARLVLQRGIGLVYLMAFLATLRQFRPLLGTHGLEPVPRFLAVVPFGRSPSLFHLRYSDRLVDVVAVAGMSGRSRWWWAPSSGRPWPCRCSCGWCCGRSTCRS